MVVKRVAPKASSRNQPLSKITHEKKQSGFHKTSSSKNDAKSEKKGKLNVIRQTKTISSNKVGPESTSTDNLSRSLIIAEKAFENVFPTALDIRDDTNDTSLAGMTNNQRKLAQATKIIGASNDPFVVASAVVSGVAAAVASDASNGLDDVVDKVHKTVAKTGSAVIQDARTGLCDVAEDIGNAGKAAVEPYLQEGEKKKAALKSSYNDAMSMLTLSYLMSQKSNASDVLDYVQSVSSQESTLKVVKKKGMRKRKAKNKNENKNENKKKTEVR